MAFCGFEAICKLVVTGLPAECDAGVKKTWGLYPEIVLSLSGTVEFGISYCGQWEIGPRVSPIILRIILNLVLPIKNECSRFLQQQATPHCAQSYSRDAAISTDLQDDRSGS